MPRLISPEGILDEEWHPLAPALRLDDYIPQWWTGMHVGRRLVEAFRTLARLPGGIGAPRQFGTFWPEMMVEWSDELAQEQADLEQKEKDARAANRVVLRPSTRRDRGRTTPRWNTGTLNRMEDRL